MDDLISVADFEAAARKAIDPGTVPATLTGEKFATLIDSDHGGRQLATVPSGSDELDAGLLTRAPWA